MIEPPPHQPNQEIKREQEKLLQYCDDLYAALAIISPDAVTVTDTDLRIIMANMQAAKLHGFRIPEQMIGKNVLRFIAEGERRRAMEDVKKIIETGSVRKVEYVLLKNDGSHFIGEVSASAVLDDECRPKAFICVTRDVSEQKEIEKTLRENEEKFRLAFEHAKDAIFWTDPATSTIIKCNRAAEILLEKPKEEIIGQQQLSLHPTSKGQHYLNIFKKHIKDKMIFDDEAEIITKSGTVKPVHITASVTYVGERTIIQEIIRDITLRKKAEARIISFKKDWENTFEAIDEAVMIHDANYNIIRANKAAVELFGMPLSKILKRKCYEIFLGTNSFSSSCLSCPSIRMPRAAIREYYDAVHNKFFEVKSIPHFEQNKNAWRVVLIVRDITERKETEKTLRENEIKYKTLVENISGMIYRGSPDWSAEIISGSKEICGYTPEEINSMEHNWLSIIHPDDRAEIYKSGTNLLKRQKAIVQVYRIIDKNGDVRWVEDHKKSLFSEKGDLLGIDGIVLDITGRKKAERELHKSRRQLHSIINSSPVILWSLDKNGIVTLSEGSGLKVLGLESGQVVGQSAFELYKDFPEIVSHLRRCLEGEEFTKDVTMGNISFVTHYIPIRNKKREVIGLTGISTDISQRRQVERALLRSEERFRQIAENAQVWIWEVDPVGLYTYSSSICEKIVGYSPKEIVGQKYFYDLIIPEEREIISQATFEFFRKRVPFRSLTNRCKHKDGSILWISKSGVPILNQKGDLVGYRGVDVDITKYKKSQIELQTAKEKLQDQAWGLERTNKSIKLLSEELQKLNKKLSKSNTKLKRMALIDNHTGLFNHRYFEDAIEREFYRAERENESLSLIMIDLDYFKSINDVYGHKFGDIVLKQFTNILKKVVRRYDIAVRYGGEEFVVISPGSDRNEARTLALRIFNSVRASDFGNKKTKVKLKLSIAVVSYPEDKIIKSMDLIEFADRILNKAKEDGANRIYSMRDLLPKILRPESMYAQEQEEDVVFLKGKIEKLTKHANQSLVEAVFAFAKALKLKDSYTGEHAENTVRYATDLARVAGLSTEDIRSVRQAAILHDLGKIGISENILQKKTKLSPEEFEEIKRHPQIAVDIIRPIHFLHNLIPFVLYHHERWDGKGYPAGLKAENIPLGARIVALADVYHALTSDRPYRKAFTRQKALHIIKEGSGTQFDPKIVDLFFKTIAKQEKEEDYYESHFFTEEEKEI